MKKNVEENKTKYILELTKEQERIVETACEFYARVLLGQFNEISYRVFINNRNIPLENREDADELLYKAKQLLFPDISKYASYGVGHDPEADTAWNAYQSLRYTRAWHDYPEGDYMNVIFDEPCDFGEVGIPKCTAVDKI